MSYGAFVHACIEERSGRLSTKFADQLADFPERRVAEALDRLGWPRRQLSFGEVYAEVKRRTPPAEREAWLAQLDAEELRDWSEARA